MLCIEYNGMKLDCVIYNSLKAILRAMAASDLFNDIAAYIDSSFVINVNYW